MAKLSEIKLNELITFGIVVLFMFGVILFNKSNPNETNTVYGDNIVWVDFHDTQMDIFTRNIDDIFGVQFEFDGVTLISSSNSGYLKENGFEISNNDKVILSFSFQGKAIPPGEYKLLTLNVAYLNSKYNVTMNNMVMAGDGGKALDFIYFDTNKNMQTVRSVQ